MRVTVEIVPYIRNFTLSGLSNMMVTPLKSPETVVLAAITPANEPSHGDVYIASIDEQAYIGGRRDGCSRTCSRRPSMRMAATDPRSTLVLWSAYRAPVRTLRSMIFP